MLLSELERVDWNIPNDKIMKIEEEVNLNMRKFDYVMIFTIYGKNITSQGSKWNFFTKYGQKITSQGVKSLRNQSYAYHE